MCDGDHVFVSDLLEMQLEDISDLLLDKLVESGQRVVKFDLSGCCDGERFILRVCLCKGEI